MFINRAVFFFIALVAVFEWAMRTRQNWTIINSPSTLHTLWMITAHLLTCSTGKTATSQKFLMCHVFYWTTNTLWLSSEKQIALADVASYKLAGTQLALISNWSWLSWNHSVAFVSCSYTNEIQRVHARLLIQPEKLLCKLIHLLTMMSIRIMQMYEQGRVIHRQLKKSGHVKGNH